jgi:hypothetical protein
MMNAENLEAQALLIAARVAVNRYLREKGEDEH